MKIAIWHNLPSGGGKRALYHHVKGLVERGHHIEAWAPDTADADFLPLNGLIEEHILPLVSDRYRILTLCQPGFLKEYNFIQAQIRSLDTQTRKCAEEINAKEFDVLLACSSRILNVSPAGQYVKIPRVLYLQEPCRQLHEVLPEALKSEQASGINKDSSRKWNTYIRKLMEVLGFRAMARAELRAVQAYDRILVNSFFSRENVLRAYGLDASVCSLGVDTDLFRPSGIERERFVVGVGAIAGRKAIDRSLRAMAAMPRDQRCPLIWVGDMAVPSYRSYLEKLAQDLNVDLRLKVGIPDTELVDILNRASVMIYTPYLEPFGFAPLEANACGLPVVAVAEGGVRETIRDGINGTLVADSDPALLAEALIRYLDSPDLVKETGKTAREYVVSKWKWEDAVTRLEDHLVQVVSSISSRIR